MEQKMYLFQISQFESLLLVTSGEIVDSHNQWNGSAYESYQNGHKDKDRYYTTRNMCIYILKPQFPFVKMIGI